jgi:MFS family permease
MLEFIVFLHILGAFGFLLGHGASAAATFQLPRESDMNHIRALLDLSRVFDVFSAISILILLLGGILAGIIGRWWNQGWIWLSLGLLIAIGIHMAIYGSRYFNDLRKAVGLSYRDGNKEIEAQEPATQEEINAIIKSGKPMQLMIIGFGGFALILYLMMYKPF